MTMAPTPPELAEDIVRAVGRHVRFDLRPVRAAVVARLAEPDHEDIWPRAERLAGEAIDEEWAAELLEECERALAEAHEGFLVRAARCLEAAEKLESDGLESWIAGTIRHRLAFDASWETLTEQGGPKIEHVWLPDEDGEEGDRVAGAKSRAKPRRRP